MKLASLSKILKCANGDDIITMKSEDNGDIITFMFEAPGESIGNESVHQQRKTGIHLANFPYLIQQSKRGFLSLISSLWTLIASTLESPTMSTMPL